MDVREETPSGYSESVTEDTPPVAEEPAQEVESEEEAPKAEEEKPDAEASAEDDQVTDDQSDGDDDSEDRPKRRRKPTRAERENRRLRQEMAEIRQQLSRQGQPTEPVKQAEPPKQQDYEEYADYLSAKVEYEAEQRVKQSLASERQSIRREAAEAQIQARVEAYKERIEDARDKYDDFDEVAGEGNPDLPISPVMADAIMSSDIGTDIQYHLGNNPELAAKINRMAPVLQAKEIGKLEEKLSAPVVKRHTEAPPPPKTVSGKSSVQKDPAKMSQREYEAWRNKSAQK